MSNQISSADPGQGFVGGKDFQQTGNIRSDTLRVVDPNDPSKQVAFDASGLATGITGTIKVAAGSAAIYKTSSTPAFTFTGFGTVTANYVNSQVIGNSLFVSGTFICGTSTAVAGTINLPGSYTIDTASLPATNFVVGQCDAALAVAFPAATEGPWPIFFDGATTTKVFIAGSASANALVKTNGSTLASSGNTIYFQFNIPITGY